MSELLTLGPRVCQWIEESLVVPAGPRRGLPLRLTVEQVDQICRCYEFTEAGGRFRRRWQHAAIFGPKGSSKSVVAGMLAVAELCGPVEPYDVDDDGFLVGRQNDSAFVMIAANSSDQASRTCYRSVRQLLAGSPLAEAIEIDVGKSRVELPDGRVLEPFGATAGSVEGINASFTVAEETQHARTSNGGVQMLATIQGNIDKSPGGSAWMLEVTNAPALGEGSAAEATYMRALEQADLDETARDLLLFHRQPQFELETIKGEDARDDVMEALRHVYGDAADPVDGWVDLAAIYKGVQRRPVHDGRRFYLNLVEKGEANLVDAVQWADLAEPGRTIADGERVVLGFDGSEGEDATALVAVSIDGERPHVQTVGVWQKPGDVDRADWKLPRSQVRAAVEACRNRWRCDLLVADPSIGWKSEVDDWAQDWGEATPSKAGEYGAGWVCQIWMNNSPKLTQDVVARFIGLLEGDDERPFTHDDHETLTAHTLNMLRENVRNGAYLSVGRAHQGASAGIDTGVAMILALWGVSRIPNRGAGYSDEELQEQINARLRGRRDAVQRLSDTVNQFAGSGRWA